MLVGRGVGKETHWRKVLKMMKMLKIWVVQETARLKTARQKTARKKTARLLIIEVFLLIYKFLFKICHMPSRLCHREN